MFIKILLYFFIYSFLGWCIEVVYSGLTTRKFINRGFFNGPLCPIYGFGVIAIVNLLDPVKNNLFLLFFGSVFIASIIELLTGFILEKLFHQKWWDYSDLPFNIGGYISPLFSLMWGLACLVVVDRIHPMISKFVNSIPELGIVLAITTMAIIFIIDLIATVNTIFKLNKKLEGIEELSAMIKKSSNELGDNLATGAIFLADKKDEVEYKLYEKKDKIVEKIDHTKKVLEYDISKKQKEALEYSEHIRFELKKKKKDLVEAKLFGQNRLLQAFPTLKSKRYREALKLLKDHVLKK